MDQKVLRRFPKIELHRHLEGTFNTKTLFKISQKNNLDMPKQYEKFIEEIQFSKDSEPDFLGFLGKFKNHWYRSLDDVYELTYDSVQDFSNDGIFFIELRFSPEHFALQNNFDRKEVTKLVIQAGNEAAKKNNFFIKYLITFNRSKQDEDGMINLYNELKRLEMEDIVGIDLAGDELHYPPSMFKRLFDLIRKDGMYKYTIHAGEVTPPQQIWEAIEILKAYRIGHGIAAIHDERLQMYLKEHDIPLEVCITSNHLTGAWEQEKTHPFGLLYKKGIPITINSDDPSIQGTDLTDDYVKAHDYFSLTLDDFVALNLKALQTSFVSEIEKKKLIAAYNSKLKEYKVYT